MMQILRENKPSTILSTKYTPAIVKYLKQVKSS